MSFIQDLQIRILQAQVEKAESELRAQLNFEKMSQNQLLISDIQLKQVKQIEAAEDVLKLKGVVS